MMSRKWNTLAWGIVVLACSPMWGCSRAAVEKAAPAQAAASTQNADEGPRAVQDPALVGAIDIHVHGDPEGPNIVGRPGGERKYDFVQIARAVKASGMRGFVVKQKNDQTAALAYLMRKYLVSDLEIFGGTGLGRATGGLNPVWVEHMAEVKGGLGRLVWMVTNDSVFEAMVQKDPTRITVPVSKNGELLPETEAVIAAIAKLRTRDTNGRLVMATGHNSAAEVLMMVREGNRQGLPPHVVVTHANHTRPDMTVAQMQEAVKLGAFIELLAGDFVIAEKPGATFPSGNNASSALEALRALGPDQVILSSDGLDSPETLLAGIQVLRRQGYTEPQLNRMLKENPARLLGIPTVPSATARGNLTQTLGLLFVPAMMGR